MSDRYDLTVPSEGKDGKTYWNKVGVMFRRTSESGTDRGGFSVKLSMFPDLKILAFPAEKRDGGIGSSLPDDNRVEPVKDDIPF